MIRKISLEVPDTLRKYEDFLWLFFTGMIHKLDKNSHKSTPTTYDIPEILGLLNEEILEFWTQFNADKSDENTLTELMDAANFAFLAYVALRLQGTSHADNNKPR